MEASIALFKNSKDYIFYSKNQTVFKEGQYGYEMYVIIEGKIDIFIKDKLVETIGPGGIFGEMQLIDSEPRSATAIAQTECKVLPINEYRFKAMIEYTPFFAIQVMKIMATRLRKMNLQVSQPN